MTERTAYEILGVPVDADQETIKQAYHRRARECHPDCGGSAEEMTAVNLAASVLLDPAARLRYDETGRTDRPDPDAEALGIIVNCLKSAYEQAVQRGLEPDQLDLIEIARDSVQQSIHGVEAQVAAARRNVARMRRVVPRIRGLDSVRRALLHEADTAERHAAAMLDALAGRRRALQLLATASFDVQQAAASSWTLTGVGATVAGLDLGFRR